MCNHLFTWCFVTCVLCMCNHSLTWRFDLCAMIAYVQWLVRVIYSHMCHDFIGAITPWLLSAWMCICSHSSTWHIHMCVLTLYVQSIVHMTKFKCVPCHHICNHSFEWLIHMCAMTLSVQSLLRMAHSHVCHDTISAITPSHDLPTCVPWLCVCNHAFTWLVHLCAMVVVHAVTRLHSKS